MSRTATPCLVAVLGPAVVEVWMSEVGLLDARVTLEVKVLKVVLAFISVDGVVVDLVDLVVVKAAVVYVDLETKL